MGFIAGQPLNISHHEASLLYKWIYIRNIDQSIGYSQTKETLFAG